MHKYKYTNTNIRLLATTKLEQTLDYIVHKYKYLPIYAVLRLWLVMVTFPLTVQYISNLKIGKYKLKVWFKNLALLKFNPYLSRPTRQIDPKRGRER